MKRTRTVIFKGSLRLFAMAVDVSFGEVIGWQGSGGGGRRGSGAVGFIWTSDA